MSLYHRCVCAHICVPCISQNIKSTRPKRNPSPKWPGTMGLCSFTLPLSILKCTTSSSPFYMLSQKHLARFCSSSPVCVWLCPNHRLIITSPPVLTPLRCTQCSRSKYEHETCRRFNCLPSRKQKMPPTLDSDAMPHQHSNRLQQHLVLKRNPPRCLVNALGSILKGIITKMPVSWGAVAWILASQLTGEYSSFQRIWRSNRSRRTARPHRHSGAVENAAVGYSSLEPRLLRSRAFSNHGPSWQQDR